MLALVVIASLRVIASFTTLKTIQVYIHSYYYRVSFVNVSYLYGMEP